MRSFFSCAAVALAVSVCACSSGGAGSIDGTDPSGAFGSKGRSTPALPTPKVPAPGGGGQQTPPVDSGTTDTGTNNPPADTGGTGNAKCSVASKCPSDPPRTTEEIQGCETAISGTCGAQYEAFADCVIANQVCTESGTTDTSATLSACNAQLSAYSACAEGG